MEPLSVDFINDPLAPTAIKILFPNVMPFNKFDVTVLPDVQLEPVSDVYVAPSAPQATNIELPNSKTIWNLC